MDTIDEGEGIEHQPSFELLMTDAAADPQRAHGVSRTNFHACMPQGSVRHSFA